MCKPCWVLNQAEKKNAAVLGFKGSSPMQELKIIIQGSWDTGVNLSHLDNTELFVPNAVFEHITCKAAFVLIPSFCELSAIYIGAIQDLSKQTTNPRGKKPSFPSLYLPFTKILWLSIIMINYMKKRVVSQSVLDPNLEFSESVDGV